MKQIITSAVVLTLALSPAHAQTAQTGEVEEGFDLMEEGAKLLFRGLLNEMDPAIEELKGLADEIGPKMQLFAEEMGPAFAELMAQVDDLRNYEAPELMPNGDIIIRRRQVAPEFVPQIDNDTGDVEL
ncbi:MAG: hypothetical protein AAFQ64_07900 [Pseudomonadota bacterium]